MIGLHFSWLSTRVFAMRYIGGHMRGAACFSTPSADRVLRWYRGEEKESAPLPEVDPKGFLPLGASGR
jgi:hypothetical protein